MFNSLVFKLEFQPSVRQNETIYTVVMKTHKAP